MYDFIQVILILAVPFLYPRMGAGVFESLSKLFKQHEEMPRQFLCFLMGLLIHVVGAFILKCCGSPWWLAFFVPLLSAFIVNYKLSFPRLSLNFVVWFFVVLVTGVSLFQVVNGIETPWENNYGDLPFHFGMINSFVKGDAFPPQYHIYAGEPLSYPFLINFWCALFWWLSQSYYTLHFIFIVHWVLLWMIVFFALNGNKYRVLPWAVFFAGGTFHNMNTWSWKLIQAEHKPWVTFLTSIWVTQRSMLFGAAVLFSVLYLMFEIQKRASYNKPFLCHSAFLGLFLALSPLTHAHAILVAGLYCGFLYLCWALKKDTTSNLEKFKGFAAFSVFSLLGLAFLPWLTSKTGMIKIIYGWTLGAINSKPLVQLESSLELWGYCGIPLLVAFVAYWALSRRHLQALALLALFLVGNFVLLAKWDWDQIKYFAALYLVFIFMWSTTRDKTVYFAHYLLIILCIPGIYEFGRICVNFRQFTPYGRDAISLAEEIENVTEPRAIIVSNQNHNNPVTLSGRTMYLGYTGTLWSHAVEYDTRSEIVKDMDKLCQCSLFAEDEDRKNCPEYLFWAAGDEKYFKRLCPGAQKVSAHVYRIIPKNK